MKVRFLETVEITDPQNKKYKSRTVLKDYVGDAEETDDFYVITLPDGWRTRAPKDALGDVFEIIKDSNK